MNIMRKALLGAIITMSVIVTNIAGLNTMAGSALAHTTTALLTWDNPVGLLTWDKPSS